METRYFLDKSFKTSHDSNHFRAEIEEKGFCVPFGLGCRVYSGQLAALLNADKVEVKIDTRRIKVTETVIRKNETESEVQLAIAESGDFKLGTVRGEDFAKVYKEGYDNGREWFLKEYNPNLYFSHRNDLYVESLHDLCFHEPFCVTNWKGVMPRPISNAFIYEVAYNCGIIAEVEFLILKNQSLGDYLRECHHSKEERSRGKKTKRTNSVAQANYIRIIKKYEDYIKRGFSEKTAYKALVHDFRNEYSPKSAENRLRQLRRIISEHYWDNKEQ